MDNTARQKLLENVAESARRFEQESHGCAQATVKALYDYFPVDPLVFKVSSPCSGGISNAGFGPCGGFLGGVLVLGSFFGRPIDKTHKSGRTFNDRPLVHQLREKYIEKYGGIVCRDVQKRVFGHSFNLLTEKDVQQFDVEGGHDTVCPNVVATAASWVAEILLDNGIEPREPIV